MNKNELKPIIEFKCPYCGYSFLSLDYLVVFNKITHRKELEEDCTVCGCVIRIEE